jgi:hypothetical protein
MDTQEKILSELQEMNSNLKDIHIELRHNIEDRVKKGVQGAMLTAFGCFGGLVLLYEVIHWIFSFFK